MTTPKKQLWKVIREKCLDCCCGQQNEVKRCTAEKCPLYAFRMGKTHDPYKDTTDSR